METKFLHCIALAVQVMCMHIYVKQCNAQMVFQPLLLQALLRIKVLICISQYQPRINTRHFEITKSTLNPLF